MARALCYRDGRSAGAWPLRLSTMASDIKSLGTRIIVSPEPSLRA